MHENEIIVRRFYSITCLSDTGSVYFIPAKDIEERKLMNDYTF